MFRVSNNLSPIRRGDRLVIVTKDAQYWGASIRLAKQDLQQKTGSLSLESFEVWSVHPKTTFVDGKRFDPLPLTAPAHLVQKKG